MSSRGPETFYQIKMLHCGNRPQRLREPTPEMPRMIIEAIYQIKNVTMRGPTPEMRGPTPETLQAPSHATRGGFHRRCVVGDSEPHARALHRPKLGWSRKAQTAAGQHFTMARSNFAEVAAGAPRKRANRRRTRGKTLRRLAQNHPTSVFGIN